SHVSFTLLPTGQIHPNPVITTRFLMQNLLIMDKDRRYPAPWVLAVITQARSFGRARLYALQRFPGLLNMHTVMVSYEAYDFRKACGAKDRMTRLARPDLILKIS